MMLRNASMKKKRAIIIFELVDESVEEKNDNIAKDLINWFREDAVSIPWVKDVKGVTVRDD
jgi:hypothetical protein